MQKMTVLFLLVAAACGPGRTSAALQPVSAAYDPSKNDPKALELIEHMTTALGGAATWAAVKQLSFDVEIELNKEVKAVYHHDWDRWNARHRFEHPTMSSLASAKENNDPKLIEQAVAMYRLFTRARGVGYFGRRTQMEQGLYSQELDSSQRKEAIERAYERWTQDAFMVSLPYRLTDPGVYVKHDGERSDDACPAAKCVVIAITFDPEVSVDKYWLNLDAANYMPVVVEWERAGADGRIAYAIAEWQDAGGLKFPSLLDNVGVRDRGDSEMWRFKNIVVGSPKDSLYIPQVH